MSGRCYSRSTVALLAERMSEYSYYIVPLWDINGGLYQCCRGIMGVYMCDLEGGMRSLGVVVHR
jgi:hypothetical protein